MTGATVRFVIVSAGPVSRWQARCAEALASVPGVTIARWIQVPREGRGWYGSGGLALEPATVPDAVERFDGTDGPGTPGIGTARDAVADDGDSRADVVVDLTPSGWRDAGRWAAETWHFAFGDTANRDPGRAALIDFVATPGRSRIRLVAEPGQRVLREGRLAWWRGSELERLLIDTAGWPASAARDRLDGRGAPARLESAPGAERELDDARDRRRRQRLGHLPTPLLGVAAGGRRIQQVRRVLFRHDNWNVGIVDAPIERFLTADGALPTTWLPTRPGHFAADPFGIERDGILHVFYEDYDQRRGRGSIGHVAVDPSGAVSEAEIVLDPGVHTSYPYLVEADGGIFLLPETSTANELVLYEPVEFPHRWRRAAVLLSGLPAVDATVIERDGRWWMFATSEDLGPNHSLLIWHAPALTGPWTAHDRNPVKTDSRSARPGGTPFVVDGRLYRPSQDCELAYGRRLTLNVVEELTPTTFVERPVRILEPDGRSAYPSGFHTLAAAGRRTLVDGNARGLVRETLRLTVDRRVARARRRSRDPR